MSKYFIYIIQNVWDFNSKNIKIDDKRLDKWVSENEIKPLSAQSIVALTPVDVEKSRIITRGTKRKMEVLYPQSQELTDLPPEIMDQEKKYQEKTKVFSLLIPIKDKKY